MKSPALFTLLALSLCTVALAQGTRDDPVLLPTDPSLEEVRELLRSESARDVALGAAIVRRDRILSVIPDLTDVLVRFPPRPDLPEDSKLAVLCVLDSLAALETRVPTSAVKPWATVRGHHLGALVAIAKNGRDAELLLELFDQAGGNPSRGDSWWMSPEVWLAAGNVLSEWKVREFAARVLTRYRPELTIIVRDEAGPAEERLRSATGYTKRQALTIPAGFPPLAVHVLRPDEKGRTIRTERRELKAGPNLWDLTSGWLDWEGVQWHWISTLLGEEFGVRPRTRVILGWESEANFLAQAAAIRAAAVAEYWQAVALLLKAERLTVEEARTLGPRVAVRVLDERSKPRKGWLPEVAAPVSRCPFKLGDGPPPGTLPKSVSQTLSASSEVEVDQIPRREKHVADAAWGARFRTVLGELGPDRFIPALTSWSPAWGVVFRGPGGMPPVEVRLDLRNELVRILASDEPLHGYWSIRGRCADLLRLMAEQCPPEKGGNSRFASIRDELWHVILKSPAVKVYAFRAGESRAVDAKWAARFRKLVGRPDPERYYVSLPEGLHEPEYEVIFSPPEDAARPEDVAFRISFTSGYFSMRRSDMGLVGFWSLDDVLSEVLALVKEVFPEERRVE